MTRVGYDLPVMVEGMTLGQCGHYDGNEGQRKEDIEHKGTSPIKLCPTLTDDLLHKLENGNLGSPDVDGIPYASTQNQAASNGSMVDFYFGQATGYDIVGPPQEYWMDESHAYHKRYDTPEHDLVLTKQLFGANPSSHNTDQDDNEGEDGTPPTDNKGRIQFQPGFGSGRLAFEAREYLCYGHHFGCDDILDGVLLSSVTPLASFHPPN